MDDDARLADHLKTLSICHYVYAGLSACGACVGGIFVALALAIPELVRRAPKRPDQPDPEEFMKLFGWLYGGIGAAIIVFALTFAVLCFLSGRAMARRRGRTLSLVVAGIACMTGLIGIALGVFTFIVLLKPETERLYAKTAAES